MSCEAPGRTQIVLRWGRVWGGGRGAGRRHAALRCGDGAAAGDELVAAEALDLLVEVDDAHLAREPLEGLLDIEALGDARHVDACLALGLDGGGGWRLLQRSGGGGG